MAIQAPAFAVTGEGGEEYGNSRYSHGRRVVLVAAARVGSLRKEEDEEVPPRRTRAQSLPPPPPDSLSLFVAAPTASRQTRAGVKASCLPLCHRADAAATSRKTRAAASHTAVYVIIARTRQARADEEGARAGRDIHLRSSDEERRSGVGAARRVLPRCV